MGAFIVSFHAKTQDPSPIRGVLAAHAERAWIGRPANGWVPFYDEAADTQDGDRIEELCGLASAATDGPVIAFLVHDSDFVCYSLFERGKKRDEYNSFPDYFGDPSDLAEPGESPDDVLARLRGDVDALLPLCPAGTNRKSLEKLLRVRPGEHVFAEEHLQKLAQALGIDPERAATTYRDISLEVPAEDLGLEFVGSGSPPDPREDSWRSEAALSAGRAPSVSLFDPSALRAALGRATEAAGGRPDPTAIFSVVQEQLQEMSRKVTDPNQKLNLAVMSRNAAGVREAIAAGAEPNASAGAALTTAISLRADDMIRLLLDLGADPKAAPMALGTAVSTGNEPAVRLLLERGADPKALTHFGWSPLHFAVQARTLAITRLLLDCGADPKLGSPAVGTPLALAEKMLAAMTAAGPFPGSEGALSSLREIRDLLAAAAG